MKNILILYFIAIQGWLYAQSITDWHTTETVGYGDYKKVADGTLFWFSSDRNLKLIDNIGIGVKTHFQQWQYNLFFVKLGSDNKVKYSFEFYTTDSSQYAGSLIYDNVLRANNSNYVSFYYRARNLILNNDTLFSDTGRLQYYCIARFSESGKLISCWRYPLGINSVNMLNVVLKPYPGGHILLAGSTGGRTITLGPYTLPCIGCHSHDTDVFVALLDSSGTVLNAKLFGSDTWDYCFGAVAADDGAVYLAGHFYGPTFRAGQDSLINEGIIYHTSDAFLLKLDQNLEVQWLKKAWGKSSDNSSYLTRDVAGNLYWAVEYSGNAIVYEDTLLSGIYANAFVAKISPEGTLRWIQNITADDVNRLFGLEVNTMGDIWVTSNFGRYPFKKSG